MAPLRMQTSKLGRHVLVTLGGEIDASNSRTLTDRLIVLLGEAAEHAGGEDGAGARRDEAGVIVHLAELAFCDASGLSSFVVAAGAAEDLGVGFAVAGASGLAERILDVTGLAKAEWVHPDLSEAVRALYSDARPSERLSIVPTARDRRDAREHRDRRGRPAAG
ncbi:MULTISPECIES: STAS domain-containing protein [Actinomadura]|uniref:STAS domain-containing protein n=1 Tax=Actinomadura yumaensis TaxID=111807 RepID=A0ABW2CF30_9ACTN|nr:STAS domain-containing protein [Actinomadura sp. J1-007]